MGYDSYSMTVSLVCDCPGDSGEPMNVLVRDGVVESLTVAADGSPAAESVDRSSFTVTALFGLIEDALNAGDAATAEFDSETGLPLFVGVVFKADAPTLFRLQISDFLPHRAE